MWFTLLAQSVTFTLVVAHACWPPMDHQHGCLPQGRGHHHPWTPGHGIARSPCPALNALANENHLPYSGRGITPALAITAFATFLNFDAPVISLFTTSAIAQCSNLTATNCTAFDLDMLNVPHAAEHDGSLSRADFDYGRGDNHDFNASIWDQVMDLWNDTAVIDFSAAQSARVLRFRNANATDLQGWFEPVVGQSLGETAFYMSAFGDPVLGMARKDWVHYFFSEERLPYALGWNASQRQLITAPLLYGMIATLAAAEVVL